MMKRITLALTVAALMAGCSSGVKLDDVPVEDKNATSTMGGAAAPLSERHRACRGWPWWVQWMVEGVVGISV